MTIRLMPKGVDVDLEQLKEGVKSKLDGITEQVGFKVQPIAFGLKALDISLMATEEKGSTVEELLATIEGVQSVNVESVSLV